VAAISRGRLVGAPGTPVRAVAPLDRAGDGDICFFDTRRYAPLFAASRAAVVLVPPALADAPGPPVRVVVENPRDALLALIPRLYVPPPRVAGVHPTAQIGRGVQLPPDAVVEPYVVIGDCAQIGARASIGSHVTIGAGVSMGDDVTLFPGVTLYAGTRVGHRVVVHAGARIGSDGFGYVYRNGEHAKIPHVGQCVIGDDVEIGANTTIDRGSVDDTTIGAGTKIDNLVHVGHNVRIGRLCLIMAQVGIAGSSHLEDGCILAGQVGLSGHLTIGAGAMLGAQAGVFGNVPAGEKWSGYPARPHTEDLRAHATVRRLTPIVRALERLVTRGAQERKGKGDRHDDATPAILEGDA
jgi:UDP-3-O-[3-hydroxymyristoyl] glucosamine N-acyltransferase